MLLVVLAPCGLLWVPVDYKSHSRSRVIIFALRPCTDAIRVEGSRERDAILMSLKG